MSAIEKIEHLLETGSKYHSEYKSTYSIWSSPSTTLFSTKYEERDYGSNSAMTLKSDMSEFEQQMILAKKIMKKNQSVLKRLAE